jgi:hypothetical protein
MARQMLAEYLRSSYASLDVSNPLVHVSPCCYFVYSAIHAKRVTIMPKDMRLARRIRGDRS